MDDIRIGKIEFSSLLSYSPHGTTSTEIYTKNLVITLKKDQYLPDLKNYVSIISVLELKKRIYNMNFINYFSADSVLVPVPGNSMRRPNTIWVPKRLAEALIHEGLGGSVSTCLERLIPIKKSSTSKGKERPKPIEHYKSLSVQTLIDPPSKIVLIDDVITSGSTLLGAANKLADAFPNSQIRAFAFVRTITNPADFHKFIDPCKGSITLCSNGRTARRP